MRKLCATIALTIAFDLAVTEVYFDARKLVLPDQPVHHHFLPKCPKEPIDGAVWHGEELRCVHLPVDLWRS